MVVLIVAVFVLQAAAMLVDERVFHRRRGLPRWERIGHPLDTATVLACYAWLLLVPPSRSTAVMYVVLVMFSSAFVTKDEPLHAERCPPREHWLHAILFVLHPMVLLGAGWLWWTAQLHVLIVAQLVLTAVFGVYQILYWSPRWRHAP